MKLKKKCVILSTVYSAGILGLIGSLYALGLRITYAPELESSWDAISACAAWAGVIMSFIAIIFAIKVPNQIADRQDKIALFEKRFECYMVIQDLLNLSSYLKKTDSVHNVQRGYRAALHGKEASPDVSTNDSVLVYMTKTESILVSGRFLFPAYDVELWEDALNNLCHLMISLCNRLAFTTGGRLTNNEINDKKEFCRLCEKFEKEYLDKIEQEMDLKKN